MDRQAYELGYRYGNDLKEIPTDSASMQAYVDALIQEIRKYPSPPTPQTVRLLVRDLGDIGTYARILGKLEAAQRALDSALDLIEKFQLSPRTWALHTLRYGEVLRFKADYLPAEATFRSVIELGTRSPEAKELEDFAWQLIGKLHFDQQQWDKAEICFLRAFFQRQNKGAVELLECSRFALRTLKARMQMKPVR